MLKQRSRSGGRSRPSARGSGIQVNKGTNIDVCELSEAHDPKVRGGRRLERGGVSSANKSPVARLCWDTKPTPCTHTGHPSFVERGVSRNGAVYPGHVAATPCHPVRGIQPVRRAGSHLGLRFGRLLQHRSSCTVDMPQPGTCSVHVGTVPRHLPNLGHAAREPTQGLAPDLPVAAPRQHVGCDVPRSPARCGRAGDLSRLSHCGHASAQVPRTTQCGWPHPPAPTTSLACCRACPARQGRELHRLPRISCSPGEGQRGGKAPHGHC